MSDISEQDSESEEEEETETVEDKELNSPPPSAAAATATASIPADTERPQIAEFTVNIYLGSSRCDAHPGWGDCA